MNDRPDIRITQLRRHPERGHWTARAGGFELDRKSGSWQIVENGRHGRRDVLPAVARALQDRVRPLERAERGELGHAVDVERRRRIAEYRELKPTARDMATRIAELPAELERELNGATLERIWTTPALAWARPASWPESGGPPARAELFDAGAMSPAERDEYQDERDDARRETEQEAADDEHR